MRAAEARYQEDKVVDSAETDGGNTDVTPPRTTLSKTFTAFLPRFTARYR